MSIPKMRDIAEKTGLNISTVSRALRDAPDISPETVSLVKRAAMQMGYHLRTSGRGSNTIGLIVPEVGSHYYSEMEKDTSLIQNAHPCRVSVCSVCFVHTLALRTE